MILTNNNEKPSIILDLDQTLISGEATENYDFGKNKKKAKKFNFENMEDYYIIFERPHLQKFLNFLFKHFNVSIWTAASKDYALFIIEKILLKKKDRKIDYIFFSYHCGISKKKNKGKKTKDLSLIWKYFKMENYKEDYTFILDDYKEDVYNCQKDRCILAKPFEFTQKGSEKDKFLLELIPKLKKICKERYEMKNKIFEINNINIEKYNL
jgi:hypothetical protein